MIAEAMKKVGHEGVITEAAPMHQRRRHAG
jgi:hypothetical protein